MFTFTPRGNWINQSEDEWCHYIWYKCQFVMLYLAWDREINISLFFCDVFVWKWGPSPEQAAVVTLATRVLRPLKRAFLTLTLIIQLDSSVLKENHKYICFFQMKVFWKLRPIFDTHHAHESQISRAALFFAASCFLSLFSYSFFLGKTDS